MLTKAEFLTKFHSTKLFDQYGRRIDTLRISLTDRCNLRCLYCMPAEGLPLSPRSELLSFEEIIKLAKCLVGLGVDKIKLTGGEPLARKGVVDLVKGLSELSGLKDLGLTTNGVLLPFYAEDLRKAGLKRINVSLDTLRKEKFEIITGRDQIADVLAGIELVLNLEFNPVKINTVLLKGINDDEINDFVDFAYRRNLLVRFIEFMPTDNRLPDWDKYFIGRDNVLARIKEAGNLVCEERGVIGGGPAEYFRIDGGHGRFGIISPLSRPFCRTCNRIRVTAKGELILCLHHSRSLNLRVLLKTCSEEELRSVLQKAVLNKPAGHHLNLLSVANPLSAMSQIGG